MPEAVPAMSGISGLVAEYIVVIDVTRVRFPADAYVIDMRMLESRKHNREMSNLSIF